MSDEHRMSPDGEYIQYQMENPGMHDAPAPAVSHTTTGKMLGMGVGIYDPSGEVTSVTYEGKEIWPSKDPRFDVSVGPAPAVDALSDFPELRGAIDTCREMADAPAPVSDDKNGWDAIRDAAQKGVFDKDAPAQAGVELPERYADILRDEIAKSLATTEARVRAEVEERTLALRLEDGSWQYATPSVKELCDTVRAEVWQKCYDSIPYNPTIHQKSRSHHPSDIQRREMIKDARADGVELKLRKADWYERRDLPDGVDLTSLAKPE